MAPLFKTAKQSRSFTFLGVKNANPKHHTSALTRHKHIANNLNDLNKKRSNKLKIFVGYL
jgi:hypothetical protein